jgi:hypothetical protein
LVFKIFKFYFSQIVFLSIIVTIFLIYMVFYYLSYQKVIKEIPTYFSSIAEK